MKQCPRSYLAVNPQQSHAGRPRASHVTSWHQARRGGSASNAVLSGALVVGTSLMLVLGAVLTLPYGYFSLLRVVVCGCSAYLAWLLFESEKIGWAVALGGVALLFNPFLPVYLTRGIWQVLDLAAAVVMVASAVTLGKKGA